MNILHPSVIAIACIIPLAACGKRHEERVIEKAIERSSGGKAKVDISEGKFELETGEGKLKVSSGDGIEIPAAFPKDVYVYEGAKAMTSMTMPKGYMLTLETNDPAAKVAAAYQSRMEAEGWKQEMAMDTGDAKVFTYKKGDLVAQVTIVGESDGGKTTISLTTSAEE